LKNKSIPPAVIRKQTRGLDAKKLDALQKHLNKKGLYTLREKEIFNKSFSHGVRISDLYFPIHNLVLEHNTTKVHGELGYENIESRRKYADYIKGKQHFLIINQDLCKELNIDEGGLAIYLYYHELAKIKAEVEI